ncbi:fimbrial protein [Acinetobacter guillouiae]|uniref:fimbrial protein n=1 Tax=Acinetobacter guillouiae TaxID=106649 RepID=UPI003AF7A8AC
MNKLLWLLAPLILFFSQSVFAITCTLSSVINFNRTPATINNINYTETITDTNNVGGLANCDDKIIVRSDFRAAAGNTNLTATGSGSFPFGVDSNLTLSNSTGDAATQNLAKTWLSQNLKLSFDLRDDINKAPVAVTALNTNYNVHPNTSQPGRVMINGEQYLSVDGLRNAGFSVPHTGIALINQTRPSSDIITALSGATVRIHMGRITFKYGIYPPQPLDNPKVIFAELYLNLKLSFNLPTCTMSNQTVNLATVSTGVLNTNQTANEQNFNISINCTTSMPSKILLATIQDSYTPSNVNSNGILINHPSLTNRSNVDIQLRDETDTPLAIGSESSFYSIPAGSTATTFIKALKARYFRSAPTATPGFVQTQATVSLDYQ